MKIIAVHLLNDFSGSPRVLSQLVRGWVRNGLCVTVACSKGPGLLSSIAGARYAKFHYQWHSNRVMRLISLLISQWRLFRLTWKIARKEDIVYINTVPPFGAAIAAKMKGCRVIYHLHETSVRPAVLKNFLFGIMKWAANDVVYVSGYLAAAEPVANVRTHLLPNAIEQEFLDRAIQNRKKKTKPVRVLMVCSLKAYKGVDEFLALAALHPGLRFQLVLNAQQHELDVYFRTKLLPANLELVPVQHDLHRFYAQADIIVNLSRPDEWIETFGLTILEGMAYGLPALIPPVGGITELVEHGRSGYWTNSRNLSHVSEKLSSLTMSEVYQQMAETAAGLASGYSESAFVQKSLAIILKSGLDKHSKKWKSYQKNRQNELEFNDFKLGTTIVNTGHETVKS
ncbi:MAG TPA: glycosyltransferase family 4 protein [Cyclobacteriaceae bacterium]|nr:glycosyltransferase family 4 protein [Cyclobacteriaceae bacterium]